MKASEFACIQVVLEEGGQFADLGLYCGSAVSLVGVVVVVFLVTLLSRVELLQLLYFGHEGSRMAHVLPVLSDFIQHGLDHFQLLGPVVLLVEDAGSILGACIVALAVESGGVVQVHEDVEDS